MDSIKQWALGITVSAVIGGIVLVLTPRGSTEKSVRTAVALVLLCAMLTPFMSGVDFTEIFSGIEKSDKIDTAHIESQITQQTEAAVKEKITEILKENGILSARVNIDISMSDNRELMIEKAEISADRKYSDSFSSAQEEIKNQLGIAVEIGVTN